MNLMQKMCQHQCQSCGMPLSEDPKGGGTEKDGTKSTKYCSLCYEKWAFIGGECTLDEMKMIVDRAMREKNMNWLIRKMALMQIPHLERWKKK